MDGFRSMLVYLPEEKLAVAYTSNGVIYPAQDIVRGVLEIYQNKPFEIPTFESIGSSRPVKAPAPARYISAIGR
jgi:D-alanyl-D-alanine carboxypeptidase